MHIERLILENFRCFGPTPTIIELSPNLTAFVGLNGAGKTATMQALQRMFGVTAEQKRVRKQDFHVPAEETGAPQQRTFSITAVFAFPELDDDNADHSAVPEFFQQAVSDDHGHLKCVMRLEGLFEDDGTTEGATGAKMTVLPSLIGGEDEPYELRPAERSRIQLIYVPASRDGASQITSFLKGRLWRAVNWSDSVREEFGRSSVALNSAFREEEAVKKVSNSVTTRWQQLHSGGTFTTPLFNPVDSQFEDFIRKVEVLFHPDPTGRDRGIEELSDGQRSLFHLALTSASLDIEKSIAEDPQQVDFKANTIAFPALTIIAVEEPENNLAPFYLSRIVRQIESLTTGSRAQAMVSSHSASILSRVEPTNVRHFRLEADRTAVVTCPHPAKILAISFKSDAATNLANRVKKRCPPELANRFSSVTFDSFTKGLVDRFLPAIPQEWRPSRGYELQFPSRNDYVDFLAGVRESSAPGLQQEIVEITPTLLETYYVGTTRLSVTPDTQPASGSMHAASEWIRHCLRTKLTFVGLNRLAEVLVRANPQIRKALQVTYPFVFVDEFQDTTYAQYDFLLSLFGNGAAAVTAVGDDKQRIMAWAGARSDSFPRFQENFHAENIPLTYNFRSSPELVRIQQFVAQAIDQNAVPAQSQTQARVTEGAAQIWSVGSQALEASHLADWLQNDIAATGQPPSNYAILVRQRSEAYEDELSAAFQTRGLSLWNESRKFGQVMLQELLVDPYFSMVTLILRLAVARRNPTLWQNLCKELEELEGVDPDDTIRCHEISANAAIQLRDLTAALERTTPSSETITPILEYIRAIFPAESLSKVHAAYRDATYLTMMEESASAYLMDVAERCDNWSECITVVDGLHQIPLMTVHKSKGLEYDTIIFLGLDDNAWWSYAPNNPEGKATFFVALTRAKQRAIFSFCRARGNRTRIAELYQLLHSAGVTEVEVQAGA